MVIGHTKESLEELARRIGATNVDDVLSFLSGKGFAKEAQTGIVKLLGKGVPTGAGVGSKVARFAAGQGARNVLLSLIHISEPTRPY